MHAPVKGDVHMLELMIQLDGHAEGESLKGRIDPRPLSFDVRHPPTYGAQPDKDKGWTSTLYEWVTTRTVTHAQVVAPC